MLFTSTSCARSSARPRQGAGLLYAVSRHRGRGAGWSWVGSRHRVPGAGMIQSPAGPDRRGLPVRRHQRRCPAGAHPVAAGTDPDQAGGDGRLRAGRTAMSVGVDGLVGGAFRRDSEPTAPSPVGGMAGTSFMRPPSWRSRDSWPGCRRRRPWSVSRGGRFAVHASVLGGLTTTAALARGPQSGHSNADPEFGRRAPAKVSSFKPEATAGWKLPAVSETATGRS